MSNSSTGPTSGYLGRRVLTVFLSSTGEDLEDHRAKVAESVERLGLRTEWQERFGALPGLSLDECRERVVAADVLVVCVAHRYGWVPPKDTAQGTDGVKSITWYEVEAAELAGKPVLAFLVDPDFAWTAKTEQDRLNADSTPAEAQEILAAVKALDRFKGELSQRVRDTFTTPDDLARKVATSLANWQRESGADAEDAIASPTPEAAAAGLPSEDTFDYRRLEIRFRPGRAGGYPIEVSEPGQPSTQGSLRLDPAALASHLWANPVPARDARSNVDAVLPSLASAREVGAELFRALLGSQVGDALRTRLRQVDPQRRSGLRFVLDASETPEVARLPWEFAYDEAERSFVFTAIQTPLVRWLRLDRPLASLAVAPPLKILFAVAAPSDLADLAVSEELAHLDRELADVSASGAVTLHRLESTSLDRLIAALADLRPHVLHFIGHGNSDGESGVLFLEDDERPGQKRALPGAKLADLLRNHSHHLRLVFLNSCLGAAGSTDNPFGGIAQWLVRRGIPAVVAMQFPVTDKGAVVLAREFYRRLGDGSTVDAALASARNVLSLRSDETAEWGAPVLYMQTPEGRLIDIAGTTSAESAEAAPPPGRAAVEPVVETAPKSKRWLRLGCISALLAVGIALALVPLTCKVPPQQEIDAAKASVAAAKDAEAATYAPDALTAAEKAWSAVEAELENQDENFAKSFTKVSELVAAAKAAGEKAQVDAGTGKEAAKQAATAAIANAQTAIDAAAAAVAAAPKSKDRKADLEAMTGDLETLRGLVAEAQAAFDRGDYKGANQRAEQATTEANSIVADVAQAAAW